VLLLAEHPDVQRFLQALELRHRVAFDTRDEALLTDLLDADVVWRGALGQAESASGKEEVIFRWNALAREEAIGIEIGEVYADGQHAVAALELIGTGRQRVRQAAVFHLREDGRVSEFWSLPADSAAAEALARGETVAEHPNLAVFSRAEETRARNTFEPEDLEALNAFLREDVRWHGAGGSKWAGSASGRDEVIGLFKTVKEATGGTIRTDLHGVFADDTHGLSFVTITASRADKPGRRLDLEEVDLFHLDDDGRAFEVWSVPHDAQILDRFWAA
jgi:ketosteroid isomerase-like protein